MPAFQTIRTEKKKHVFILTLSRPEVRNAMNGLMYHECTRALDAADADPDVHCVILTGEGSCFSAGRDLKERNKNRQSASDYLETTLFSREGPAYFYSYLTQYRKPLITAINGPAVAGGCIVAVLGDVSIASNKAFFALPEIDRGIPPPGGVMVFPKLMSRAKGAYLLMTGARISADEAERIGMISIVVPARRLMSEAMHIADVIAKKSPIALRLLKTAMLTSAWGDDLKMNIAREAIRAIGDVTRDRVEGISAFVDLKRRRKQGRGPEK